MLLHCEQFYQNELQSEPYFSGGGLALVYLFQVDRKRKYYDNVSKETSGINKYLFIKNMLDYCKEKKFTIAYSWHLCKGSPWIGPFGEWK